jgi:hypothetical protein
MTNIEREWSDCGHELQLLMPRPLSAEQLNFLRDTNPASEAFARAMPLAIADFKPEAVAEILEIASGGSDPSRINNVETIATKAEQYRIIFHEEANILVRFLFQVFYQVRKLVNVISKNGKMQCYHDCTKIEAGQYVQLSLRPA